MATAGPRSTARLKYIFSARTLACLRDSVGQLPKRRLAESASVSNAAKTRQGYVGSVLGSDQLLTQNLLSVRYGERIYPRGGRMIPLRTVSTLSFA